MTSDEKQHAKDYLEAFAIKKDTDQWLKELITDAINTNGQILKPTLDDIYSNLENKKSKSDQSDKGKQDTDNQSGNDGDNLIITKLQHIQGVNALANDQTIYFNKNVTILYGPNGSGKSSYFRVLNEIVGGNEKKEILPNIYKNRPDDPHNIKVKLYYSHGEKGGKEKEVSYDREKRGLPPLTHCKVFDSSYLKGLLSERTQDEAILKPFGLHLFQYIANQIDSFKNKLDYDAKELISKKPKIQTKQFTEEIKQYFEDDPLSKERKNIIENVIKKKWDFTNEDMVKLKLQEKTLKDLEQNNYQDTIDLLENQNTELQDVITMFLKLQKELNQYKKNIKDKLKILKEKEKNNKDVLQRTLILKDLSFSDTNEWKSFISAGDVLREKHQTDDTKCLYCNQDLQDEAKELIKAYSTFLSDKSEDELTTAEQELDTTTQSIHERQIRLPDIKVLKKKYKNEKIDATDITFGEAISEVLNKFKTYKTFLLNLANKKEGKEPEINIPASLQEWLKEKGEENKYQIKTLSQSNKEKEKEIDKLKNDILSLQEKVSLKKQKQNIERYFENSKKVNDLEQISNKLNTQPISKLSKKAHKYLLTTKLKDKFQEEIKLLSYAPLEVELSDKKTDKGENITELVLTDNNKKVDITLILSEGEQKAVGLALFMAESLIQNSTSPIILDDPVNSLDHIIASKFAERLLSLNNQVIIFSHNLLFMESFNTLKKMKKIIFVTLNFQRNVLKKIANTFLFMECLIRMYRKKVL